MEENRLYNGDCLEIMKDFPDKSIDCIICDLPYGVLNKSNSNAKWDSIIPIDRLWKQYERIIKDNGAIILFGQGMFTAKMMLSNEKMWRYNLIWDKNRCTGFLNSGRQQLRCHEDIMVFYKSQPTYNPQMIEVGGDIKPTHRRGTGTHKDTNRCYGNFDELSDDGKDFSKKFPRSIIKISKEHDKSQFHPTQKPVELLRHLIRTYSNEGDLILDNCMGSGTTIVAAIMENRKYIGIELDSEYYNKACERINSIPNFLYS